MSSPIRRPTAVEPVKPTFCTRPCSSTVSSASYVVTPSATTVTRTSAGTPPAWNSEVSAWAIAGETSAGFHTTLLPHSSAGTRYQDGTAAGKFPAVMISAVPTGAGT